MSHYIDLFVKYTINQSEDGAFAVIQQKGFALGQTLEEQTGNRRKSLKVTLFWNFFC